MKKSVRLISLLLVLVMAFSTLTSCEDWFTQTPDNGGGTGGGGTEGGGTEGGGDYVMPEDEYRIPLEDGYNQLTLYWTYNGTYENCDIWIWYGDVAGQGYLFHECEYGAKVVVNVPEDVTEVGFIVRKNCSDPGGTSWGDAVKDYDQDRFAVLDGRETFIYLKPGDPYQYTSDDGGKTLKQIKKLSLVGIDNLGYAQFIRYEHIIKRNVGRVFPFK